MVLELDNFRPVDDPVVAHIHALAAERCYRKQVLPTGLYFPDLGTAATVGRVVRVNRHHLQLDITLALIGDLHNEASGGVDDIEIVLALEHSLEVKMLVGATVIIPYDEIAFGEFIAINGCNIECHFLFLCWDYLILNERVRKGVNRNFRVVV